MCIQLTLGLCRFASGNFYLVWGNMEREMFKSRQILQLTQQHQSHSSSTCVQSTESNHRHACILCNMLHPVPVNLSWHRNIWEALPLQVHHWAPSKHVTAITPTGTQCWNIPTWCHHHRITGTMQATFLPLSHYHLHIDTWIITVGPRYSQTRLFTFFIQLVVLRGNTAIVIPRFSGG